MDGSVPHQKQKQSIEPADESEDFPLHSPDVPNETFKCLDGNRWFMLIWLENSFGKYLQVIFAGWKI